jgi:hypothetical protein
MPLTHTDKKSDSSDPTKLRKKLNFYSIFSHYDAKGNLISLDLKPKNTTSTPDMDYARPPKRRQV